MPRKSTPRPAGGEEGKPARRSRKRAAGSEAAAAPAEVRALAAAAAAGANGAPVQAQPAIPHEEIQRLAYFYWLERGGQGGSPEDDWFRAEQELRRRRALASAASELPA
jgi:hypothetical protein